ncbi:hypothetical protein [Enterococcus sp. C76]|uniref:hypothetical protein n=1 Tax=Enterococcus TaxID=1350 RepID=UPI0034A0AD14
MSEMIENMKSLGFLVLESEGEYLYFLSVSRDCFLAVESRELIQGVLVYDFCKYYFNKKKQKTELIKIYFTDIEEKYALKKVSSFMIYILEHGYFKTKNHTILESAREIQKKCLNNV